MRNGRSWLASALIVDLLGATGTLLVVGRTWQHVVITRAAPLPDAAVALSGRDLRVAIPAFAFIALAGVVALAASRGLGRRIVGAAVAVSGSVIVWLSGASLRPVSLAQARAQLPSGVGIDANSRAQVSVSAGWPILSISSGLLVVVAGLSALVFASRWSQMTARYDAPTAAASRDTLSSGASEDIALWRALDRGDDPTARTES